MGDGAQVFLTKVGHQVTLNHADVSRENTLAMTSSDLTLHIGHTDLGDFLEAFDDRCQSHALPEPCFVIAFAGYACGIVKASFAGAESQPVTGLCLVSSLPVAHLMGHDTELLHRHASGAVGYRRLPIR